MDTAVATPSAPVSAPAPTSSAPATSGAPSGETQRPTMAEAFARDVSAPPADTPATETTTPETAAAAIAPTGENPLIAETSAQKPIPFADHKRIIDGAHKERDALRSELAAIRTHIDSPDGQRLRQWATAYQQNPEGWFASTVAELAQANPTLIPALRSQAARLLGSRQPAEPTTSFEPDIPVYDETGRQVAQTYSADRMKAILEHGIATALQREVGPIKQDFAQRKQEQETAALMHQATETATKQFDEAKTWPGFLSDPAKGTVDPDLVKAFTEHPEWSLDRAYIQAVVPKLRAKEQAQVLDDLKTKAAASSGVNPGSSVTTTKRPTSFTDKSLKWS